MIQKIKLKKYFFLYAGSIGIALFLAIIFFPLTMPKHTQFPTQITLASSTNAPSHSLSPMISNQWYSSLYVAFPSAPLYAMPLAFQITPQGLGFSYPTVTATADVITAPYKEDFAVGFADDLLKPAITNVGDWTVALEQKNNSGESLAYTLGHGIPYTIIHTQGNTVQVHCASVCKVYNHDNANPVSENTITTDGLTLGIGNHFYIVTFPQQTIVTLQNNMLSITHPGQIFVGLLDTKDHYNLFQKISSAEITNTQVYPDIADTKLATTYDITTSNNTMPLITLYPHQFDTLTNAQQVLGTYQTLRGPLRLVQTNTFTTSFPLITPDTAFVKLSHDYPDLTTQIKQDISNVIAKGPPNSKDYYLGTWFGKVDNLLLLADAFGLDNQKQTLLQFAEPLFLESLDNFSYNKDKTSLIANSPEFGNENLNDHHFHYGYYIRTGAVLSSFDLSLLPKITDKVNMMVDDIATYQRDATDYPFLRNFDVYEGHAWADGFGDTPDGNNQESSSEAINAWYSLYLWSKVTNDSNLQKYSLYLYNTEIESTKYYWFNSTNLYPKPYQHSIASIVWGGKVTYETWFSDQTNMKYGIELLPFTPGSAYLGTFSTFQQYLTDYQAHGGNIQNDWGDLFVMWQSFYQPLQALAEKNQVKKFEADNSKSLFLYTLYANEEANNSITPTP